MEYFLLAATQSDPAFTAGIILAYTTLKGLSPGQWAVRLAQFSPSHARCLFLTNLTPMWTSHHLRKKFPIPLLEVQRCSPEAGLQMFSTRLVNGSKTGSTSCTPGSKTAVSKFLAVPITVSPSPRGLARPHPMKSMRWALDQLPSWRKYALAIQLMGSGGLYWPDIVL
jgi:hypothetical protein